MTTTTPNPCHNDNETHPQPTTPGDLSEPAGLPPGSWTTFEQDEPVRRYIESFGDWTGESSSCPAVFSEYQFSCTLEAGHGGRHAAGTGDDVAAVWA